MPLGLHSLPEALGENPFLHLSSFQRLCTFLGSWPLFPSSEPATLPLSEDSSVVTPPSDSLLPPSSTFKDAHDYVELTWIIYSLFEDPVTNSLNAVCNVTTPVPCNLAFSLVLGIRTRTWGEGGIILCPTILQAILENLNLFLIARETIRKL